MERAEAPFLVESDVAAPAESKQLQIDASSCLDLGFVLLTVPACPMPHRFSEFTVLAIPWRLASIGRSVCT